MLYLLVICECICVAVLSFSLSYSIVAQLPLPPPPHWGRAPMSSDLSDEASHIEKLYEFGERLNESKDKSQVPLRPPTYLPQFLIFLGFLCILLTEFGFVAEFEGLPGDYRCCQDEHQSQAIGRPAHSQVLQVLPRPLRPCHRHPPRFDWGRRARGQFAIILRIFFSLFL